MVQRGNSLRPDPATLGAARIAADGAVDQTQVVATVPYRTTFEGLVAGQRDIFQQHRRAGLDVHATAILGAGTIPPNLHIACVQRGTAIDIDTCAVGIRRCAAVVLHDHVAQVQHTSVVDARTFRAATAKVVLHHHISQGNVRRRLHGNATAGTVVAALDRHPRNFNTAAAQIERPVIAITNNYRVGAAVTHDIHAAQHVEIARLVVVIPTAS